MPLVGARSLSRASGTPLEQAEKLERLRFLEHGIPIYVIETLYDTIGVDTEEDLARVEAYIQGLDPSGQT